MAILEPGENPLWFELSPEGPLPIPSPEEASLLPLLPWPLSRYIAGILPWGDAVVLALNQEGFLVLQAGSGGRILLYRIDASWDALTIGAFFFYEGKPGVFLYQDDFFTDPPGPPPPPGVFTLTKESVLPHRIDLPALHRAGWETPALRPGADGFWYYRQVRLGNPGEQAFFRTPDLSEPGEQVRLGAWRKTAEPEPLEAAPGLLGEVLRAAFALAGDTAVISWPGPPGFRTFGVPPAETTGLLRGFFREEDPPAGVILPDGRGFVLRAGGDPSPLALPPLPEGFCYTGIAPVGDALIASWEEQEEAAIAAAGFMVIQGQGRIIE